MFSQFFVLSLRGDTILHKDFRRDLEMSKQSTYNSTQEMFLSQVGIQNSFVEDNEMITKPFFERQGIQFVFLKRSELFFVFTSATRSYPHSMALELLSVIVNRIHDFCGALNEDNLRQNFVLVYEIIDEMIDFGYPQLTHPEELKSLVSSDAEKIYTGTFDYLVSYIPLDKLRLTDSVSEKESEKSIVKCSHDMFVEINEKISAQFTSNGFAIHIIVNGIVSCKNYILGRTNLKIHLVDNFQVKNDMFFPEANRSLPIASYSYGGSKEPQMSLKLTQINETVYVPEFEQSKMISLYPQMGQSNIMQYQVEGNFNMLPLKLYPTFIARQEFNKLDLTLKASCRLPANLRIKELTIRFRVPDAVVRVFIHEKNSPIVPNSQGQNWQDGQGSLAAIASYASSYVDKKSDTPEENDIADYNSSKRKVEWKVKNFRGQQTRQLELSLTFKKGTQINEVQFKQLSPFNCDFDIPNHTVSGVKISKMEVKVDTQPFGDANTGVEPGKWLRHKTFSGSYTFRI